MTTNTTTDQKTSEFEYYEITYITCGKARIPKGAEILGDKWGELFYSYEGKQYKVEITLYENDFKRSDDIQQEPRYDAWGYEVDDEDWNKPEPLDE